jgi:hypothetical protein
MDTCNHRGHDCHHKQAHSKTNGQDVARQARTGRRKSTLRCAERLGVAACTTTAQDTFSVGRARQRAATGESGATRRRLVTGTSSAVPSLALRKHTLPVVQLRVRLGIADCTGSLSRLGPSTTSRIARTDGLSPVAWHRYRTPCHHTRRLATISTWGTRHARGHDCAVCGAVCTVPALKRVRILWTRHTAYNARLER